MIYNRIFICHSEHMATWAEWIYAGEGIFVSAYQIDSGHVGLLYSMITTA